MKVDCSNCLTTITVDRARGVATHSIPAQGRGSKRTAAATITKHAWVEDDCLLVWEAPCCDDYVDSFDLHS
jgi:hypothetical protein